KAFSIRYPRGQGVVPYWQQPMEEVKIGTGRTLREGEGVAILSLGHVGNYAEFVCEQLAEQGIHVVHYDMRFVKPLDEALLHEIFNADRKGSTLEDVCVLGGFGSAVLEFMADHHYQAEV